MLPCDYFLSCDWGTSSFRLRLVSCTTSEILAEIETAMGAKAIFDSRPSAWARADLFAETMRASLRKLAAVHAFNGVPLMISGMASSTIGWKELPYAKLPFALDGSDLRIEMFDWDHPTEVAETHLISGLASASDIMRGEECQAVGIMAEPSRREYAKRALLILPGTHSKHLLIDDGKITDFRTYMTGELFATLAEHTVLKSTVERGSSEYPAAVQEGVKHVLENGLAASLFKVRVRGVLDKVAPRLNAGFLCGLLIGAEIADLRNYHDRTVIVAAGIELIISYQAALGWAPGHLFLNQIDRATVAAHRLALERVYR